LAEDQIRGKSMQAVSKDVANGFFTVNPLTVKKFTAEMIKAFHQQLQKVQREVRNERFDSHDIIAIRNRNMRLQRLHQAVTVLEHTARERRVNLL
jgi:hypothetical protein